MNAAPLGLFLPFLSCHKADDPPFARCALRCPGGMLR
jgi:hypothetical protein